MYGCVISMRDRNWAAKKHATWNIFIDYFNYRLDTKEVLIIFLPFGIFYGISKLSRSSYFVQRNSSYFKEDKKFFLKCFFFSVIYGKSCINNSESSPYKAKVIKLPKNSQESLYTSNNYFLHVFWHQTWNMTETYFYKMLSEKMSTLHNGQINKKKISKRLVINVTFSFKLNFCNSVI